MTPKSAESRRQEEQERRGVTEYDDCIQSTRIAYLKHMTYLRLKPQIDLAQEEFLCAFREELETLEAKSARVQSRVAQEKRVLRRKLKSDQIGQKAYQDALKQLTKEASVASYPYADLQQQVDRALDDIKDSMITQALSAETRGA